MIKTQEITFETYKEPEGEVFGKLNHMHHGASVAIKFHAFGKGCVVSCRPPKATKHELHMVCLYNKDYIGDLELEGFTDIKIVHEISA